MLLFEILLLTSATFYIIFSRVIHTKLEKKYIIAILFILFIVQFVFDGYRWQIIPSYIIWLIAILTAIRQPEKSTSKIFNVAKISTFTVILFLALLLPSLLPIFELPKTTGPYAVGTTDILLETDRDEVITTDITDNRRFMIKTWYPTTDTNGEQDLYIDKAGRSGFAKKYGLPPSTLQYLDNIETNVYRGASVANNTFPVLIFSHGYHSKANGYYALLSEVASQGYVIFAVNHTYESTGLTFPDGTEVYFDNNYARMIEADTWETISPVIEAFQENLDFKERHPIVQNALTTYFAEDIIKRWARDIIDVVDMLDDWNQSGFFKGNLDISNVGVFGHSRGGGAAGESLLIDNRFKAGANLDGIQWGQIVNTRFKQPFLFLSSDWPDDHENLSQHAYVNRSESVFYEGILRQSGHSNFMDIPYIIPLQALNLAGDIDPNRAFEISNNLIVTFFDKYLKNENVNLEDLDTEYEELEMTISAGDSLDVVRHETH